LRKTDNFLLWLAIIAIYFGLVHILHGIPLFGASSSLLILLTIILIIATLRPMRRVVKANLTRLLNPAYFESSRRIHNLRRSLQITQTHSEIIDNVLAELEDILDARILAVALADGDYFSIVNYRAPEPINLDNVTIDRDSEVMRSLREKGRISKITRQALRYHPTPQRKRDYRFKEYKLFNYAIPLKVNDTLTGAILTSNVPYEFIRDWEDGVLENFAEYLGIMLRNSKLYNDVRWEALQKNTLIEISKKISSSLDLNRVLQLVIDSLNQMVGYSAGGIFLVNEGGHDVYEMVVRGYEEADPEDIKLKVEHGIVGECIEERRPIIVGLVDEVPHYVAVHESTKSEMCVPIYDSNKDNVIGAFNLESDMENAFSKNDLDRLTAFAEQVSIAIENARLYQQVSETKRFKRDMEIAKEIQKAFLPRSLPDSYQYDFAAICEPSQQVGGDFYDVHQFSNGKIGIAIGDVAGKGIPGAILMANLYAGYRSRMRSHNPIHEMVGRLNDLLVESTNSEKYTTFFYGELESESGWLTYTNGGHNPPLLVHGDGSSEELTVGGPVIGALEDSRYEEKTIPLAKGDMLVLYTDGITEAQSPDGEYYEVERLLRVLEQRSRNETAQSMIDRISKDVFRFTHGEDLQDDFTIVVMVVKSVTEAELVPVVEGNGSRGETA